MKLPMRFRILHLLSQHDQLADREVMDYLRSEYGTEGQFKLPIIKLHLHSMRAVGLVENAGVTLVKEGDLVESFRITDYGRDRLKYLPRGWKN